MDQKEARTNIRNEKGNTITDAWKNFKHKKNIT